MSVLFWGWMWDVWGLVLAVPIMVAIKAAADHIEPLQPLGELLTDQAEHGLAVRRLHRHEQMSLPCRLISSSVGLSLVFFSAARRSSTDFTG